VEVQGGKEDEEEKEVLMGQVGNSSSRRGDTYLYYLPTY
jgi:hypothetical protein